MYSSIAIFVLLSATQCVGTQLAQMDPASVRALRCTSKRPFGITTDVLITNYIEGHRSRTILDTDVEEPATRCIYPVTRGRCRKRVSDVALTQYCAKHQKCSSFCYPADKHLVWWNHRNIHQHPDQPADGIDLQRWFTIGQRAGQSRDGPSSSSNS